MCRYHAQVGYYLCITNELKIFLMASSFYISPRVIDTINSLPIKDRIPISNALSSEFILGRDPTESLTPLQNMLYTMIRFYVTQDTERNKQDSQSSVTLSSFEPHRCALG